MLSSARCALHQLTGFGSASSHLPGVHTALILWHNVRSVSPSALCACCARCFLCRFRRRVPHARTTATRAMNGAVLFVLLHLLDASAPVAAGAGGCDASDERGAGETGQDVGGSPGGGCWRPAGRDAGRHSGGAKFELAADMCRNVSARVPVLPANACLFMCLANGRVGEVPSESSHKPRVEYIFIFSNTSEHQQVARASAETTADQRAQETPAKRVKVLKVR